ECRPADHRENFAGARVHSDDGAFLILEVVFRDGLQVVIDGQLNGFPGNGFDVVERAHRFAHAVHNDATHAVGTFQRVVILAFETCFADDVARTVVPVTLIELLRRNFPDVAHGIGQHFTVRVAAALDHQQLENGNIGAVRFDEGNVREARRGFDHD